MKTFKKLFSLFTIVALLFAMTLSVNAATVSIDGELDGHTFGYYQILTGTQVAGDPSLGTPTWGLGINSDTFLDEVTTDVDGFAGVTDAATFAAELAKSSDNSAIAEQVAKIAYKHVKGTATEITAETTTIAAGYYLIVDTTKNLEEGDAKNAALLQVTEKENIVIGNKTTKPTIEKTVNGKKSDDAYIGETVVMELVATIPSMHHYDTYKVIITDDAQDTFAAPSNMQIKLAGTNTNGDDVEVEVTTADKTVTDPDFTITIDDVKALAEAGGLDVSKEVRIVATYNTSLKATADLGNDGNINKVKLTYSAEPNSDETNDTAEKVVYVFSYQLEGTKVDGTNQSKKLSGAKFVLKNSEGKYYKDTDGVVSWVDVEDDATKMITENDGIFTFKGIDQGTYTLVELTPPVGYNKAADQSVVISAELSDTAITSLTNGTLTDGKVAINVLNYKGATLPETGGMGTTMLYIVGAALVVSAGVVLVSKKRMAEK